MRLFGSHKNDEGHSAPHGGDAAVLDGMGAVVHCERAAGTAAALPGAGAAARAAQLWRSHADPSGDRDDAAAAPASRTVETTGEAAALAAAAGMAEAGLRATAFVSGAALAAAHGALYGMAGKRLPLVVHVAAQAAPRPGWTEEAGHDTLNAVADTGWFQLMAWDPQSAADLALIARALGEQALVPGLVAQDAWLTTHRAATLRLPAAAGVQAYLGAPEDAIKAPTPAQRLLYGERRPRIPALWNVDSPLMTGAAHGGETLAEAVAAQQSFGLAHVPELATQAMEAYARLTGRSYATVQAHACEHADYLIVVQGSAVSTAQALAEHLRRTRRLRVGVINVVMPRPFPGAALAALLLGRRGVLVLERGAAPLSEDPPLLAAVRAALGKAVENGQARRGDLLPHEGYPRVRRLEEVPPLHGAGFGLGGREPAAGELLAALDAMAPGAPRRPHKVLGVAFAAREALTPKQEIFAQQLADAYPELAGVAERAAPDVPPLLPEGALVLRVYGAAGREPFTLDDHLGTLLHDLSAVHVQAWPDRARPRSGRPAAFTTVAAHTPLPAVDAPARTDLAVVADPAALRDDARVAELAAGLRAGGALLLVPPADAAEPLWTSLPEPLRRALQESEALAWTFDGHALAREEAHDPAAQRWTLSRLLQGALLACPPVTALTGLQGSALVRELKSVLLRRNPQAEAADVEQELALLRRGTESLRPLEPVEAEAPAEEAGESPAPDAMPAGPLTASELRTLTPHPTPVYDLHRHWEAHPQYHAGAARGVTADPFVGAGVLPAATGLLRDRSAERETYPQWLPQRCTGCGECWSLCPDAALPALVNTTGELLETGVRLMEARGLPTEHLPRAVRVLDSKWRGRLRDGGAGADVGACLAAAVAETLPAAKATPDEREALGESLEHLRAALEPFPLAATGPFFVEEDRGGLLSITLDAERCKGCGACVEACPEQALELRPQTREAQAARLRERAVWLHLPSSGEAFRTLGEGRSEPPTVETLLLDKRVYRAMTGGNDGIPGAAENTVLHLFAAAAEAALQPRADAQAARLAELIERLEAHVRNRLAVDVSDVDRLGGVLDEPGAGDVELTLADLSQRLDPERTPIDREWLGRVTRTLAGLKRLREAYLHGEGGRPRAGLGMVAALDGELAPLATYPFNAFTFPWSGQAPEAAVAALEGVAEGHLAHMAEGFRWVRIAELELDDKYTPDVHDRYFARFGWRDFTAEEWQLCPPLVLLGSDATLAADGGAGLLALLRGRLPVKVLCLDGQPWRALAAQPGSLPPWGEAQPGMADAVPTGDGDGPETALLALAQQTAWVEQGSLGDVPRLLQGFLRGLSAPRPALFAALRVGLPADGRGSALAAQQARLALVARAYPALRYDPDAGDALHERLSLAGNAQPEAEWPEHTLEHLDDTGHAASTEVALTFADFALAVPELAHHFTPAPGDADAETVTPLPEWLALDADERRESRPFVWAVDYSGRLRRWLVSAALARAAERRQAGWRLLRALTREDVQPVDEAAIAEQAKGEMVETVWRNLMELARGGASAAASASANGAGDAALAAQLEALAGGTAGEAAQGDAGEDAPQGGSHA